jgi:hypothetical protein
LSQPPRCRSAPRSATQASGLNEYATIGHDAATGHQFRLASYSMANVDDTATVAYQG